MKITVVQFGSIKDAIFKSSGSSPLKSCPVINCTRLDITLRVNGIFAAAAAAIAEDTPGIISNSNPFSFNAVISSSNLEKILLSPDFSRTIFFPVLPYSTSNLDT